MSIAGEGSTKRLLRALANFLHWGRRNYCALFCPQLKLFVDARVSQRGLRVGGVHIHALVRGLNERIHGVANVDSVHLHGA